MMNSAKKLGISVHDWRRRKVDRIIPISRYQRGGQILDRVGDGDVLSGCGGGGNGHAGVGEVRGAARSVQDEGDRRVADGKERLEAGRQAVDSREIARR